MNVPAPASSRPHWALRLLHALVVLVLGFSITGLMLLAVAGYLPAILFRLAPDQTWEGGVKSVGLVVAAVLILAPLVLLVMANRRGQLRWRNLALLGAAVAVCLGWLGHDQATLKHPLTVAEFAPEFPGADQSYAVLMRYSKLAPSAEAQAFTKRKWTVTDKGFSSAKEANARMEFVAKNRAGLEADWETLAPERHWIGELNSFDRIGDLTPPSSRANIVTFAVWRVYSQEACAMSLLRAADGRGDEAIATLLPVLECGRKLQRDSRTLVRSMIGVVLERMAIETAGTVLDRTPVSSGRREKLAAALAGGNPPADVRRVVMMEYAVYGPAMMREVRAGEADFVLDGHWAWARRPLHWLGVLLINPNATLDLMAEDSLQVAALAETRDFAKIDARTKAMGEELWRRPGMKNLGGRLVLAVATPGYAKVVESCWKTADLREDLRHRLAAKVAAN